VHGVGGILGALLTGVFASVAVNPAGADGSLVLVGKQAVAVLAVAAYTFVMTWGILWLTDRLVSLRVPETHEDLGLDVAEHGEVAYHDLPWPADGPSSGEPGLVVGMVLPKK
jgi:Amt family ammonium transporter